MKASPIRYIKNAKLRGNLFHPKDNPEKDDDDDDDGGASGLISSVDTEFWVDHTEPLKALARVRDMGGNWPLGELRDGHEFLLILEGRRRRRSL